MKRILALLLGVIAGFLAFETLTAPRDFVGGSAPTAATVEPAKTDTDSTSAVAVAPAETTVPTAPSQAPSPAAARAARERPGVFYFTPPSGFYGTAVPSSLSKKLYQPDRPALRTDPEFMAGFREFVRTGLEKDLQALRYLVRLEAGRFGQLLEIAADQVVDRHLMPKLDRAASLEITRQLSLANSRKLATVLDPSELEALAEIAPPMGLPWIFRQSIEAFAIRGLPLPTLEQLDALLAPTVYRESDGQWYRVRGFDPGSAPESMNPQQRAYLANVQRWTQARFVVTNLHNTKVRDPEVWEIWPD
jgi:hypothetical protein